MNEVPSARKMKTNLTQAFVKRIECQNDKNKQEFSDIQLIGLTLEVRSSGAKSYFLRTTVNGKRIYHKKEKTMKVKITFEYRVDLQCHTIEAYDKNRLTPISSILNDFVNLVPTESVNEKGVDGSSVTRSKSSYKVTSYKDEKIVVETEYFAIAAKCCSYLSSNEIDYKIELNEDMFLTKNADELVQIYLSDAPDTMLCKKAFDIKQNSSSKKLNCTEFKFKFDTPIFKAEQVTQEMIIDSLQECFICYSDDTQQVIKTISKKEMSSIKFTQYGLETILQWIQWHKEILNTSYMDIDEKLLDVDLIQY